MKTCIGVHVYEEPNRLALTLEHIRSYTPAEVEVLLLVDGPDAAVRNVLGDLPDLRQLATPDPRGAPAAFNRLLTAAFGAAEHDFAVFLEAGSLVGPGWLNRLLAALHSGPNVGLAGPTSNRAWNEQGVFQRARGTRGAIETTAAEALRRFGDQVRTLEPLYSLADFCLAVRREVYETIGGADEGYGQGPCWEMDYNIRAARAGYHGVWAGAAYVYRMPPSYRRRREEAARFEANKRRYQDRVCGLRLSGQKHDYELHCRGDACEHFAPWGIHPGVVDVPAQVIPGPRLDASPAASEARPLVSCIMPTRGRAVWVQQAVRYFQRQDYPERELIIVDERPTDTGRPDEAEEALASAIRACGDSVRYIRLEPGLTIGAKRNRACELARGEIVAQWDDDDWYAPDRLRRQVAPILAGEADITGLEAGVFFELAPWRFWRCTPALHRRLFAADVHGGTLVFRRDVWARQAHYPNVSLAEDAYFLRTALRHGARLKKLANEGSFVYLRHGQNAWNFPCGQYVDPAGWLAAPEPSLPTDERAFYEDRRAEEVRGAPFTLQVISPELPERGGEAIPAELTPRSGGHAVHKGDNLPAAPLLTCIMPTRDRVAYVKQAVDYFLRQDYTHAELLILDDGAACAEKMLPESARIRYVRLPKRTVLGAKRNLACEMARGSIIVHWDDDDWSAPWRLSYQVQVLLEAGADLSGAARQLYYDPFEQRAWLYEYPRVQRPWLSGGTLCYAKAFWETNRFPEVQVGEDTRFVWSKRAGKAAPTPRVDYYVALVHRGNTSPKATNGRYWRPRPVAEVQRLLGEDLSFYRSLADATSAFCRT